MTIRSRQMARTLQNGAHILRSVAIKKALHMMNFVEVHRLMKGFTLKIALKSFTVLVVVTLPEKKKKEGGGK